MKYYAGTVPKNLEEIKTKKREEKVIIDQPKKKVI